MAKKFKVGDKVVVVVGGESTTGWTFGKTGTVVRVDDDAMALVRFKKVDALERGHGPGNREWFLDEDELVLAPPKDRKAPKGPQAYKGNGKHEWEYVTYSTERLRVPGGWLYRFASASGSDISFVPVPEAVGYAV
jgi:hypothetical protein